MAEVKIIDIGIDNTYEQEMMTLTEEDLLIILLTTDGFYEQRVSRQILPFSKPPGFAENTSLFAWTFRKGLCCPGLIPTSARWNPSSMNIKHLAAEKKFGSLLIKAPISLRKLLIRNYCLTMPVCWVGMHFFLRRKYQKSWTTPQPMEQSWWILR